MTVRGMVPGLETPHPVLHLLPGVFHDGDFTARFVSAFDDALAPVFATLDNLTAYVDPETAPTDLLAFVGAWVGASREASTDLSTQRVAVREAVEAHRRRGTPAGLRQVLRHLTGGEVEVADSGGTSWSLTPGSDPPGTFPAHVRIRIALDDPESVDLAVLRSVVTDATPPHVTHEIEVMGR
ncbi:phage tail protein [Knoellia aerolata]|uniref:phage tail protein n=1 Tax=Knoellia aerolata TaxID=442954 RepID=UPI00068F15E2|nr:phage tail protein [Knoellia aerolata]